MGRYPDGAPLFHELTGRTPGTTNSGLYTRDIVINEIMFNPISGLDDDEYIEIYNRGASTQSLNGWRLTNAVIFAFPNITIGPSNYIVVATNAANLTQKYTNLVNGVSLFGAYKGS